MDCYCITYGICTVVYLLRKFIGTVSKDFQILVFHQTTPFGPPIHGVKAFAKIIDKVGWTEADP
jgi:hypothetical protein